MKKIKITLGKILIIIGVLLINLFIKIWFAMKKYTQGSSFYVFFIV